MYVVSYNRTMSDRILAVASKCTGCG